MAKSMAEMNWRPRNMRSNKASSDSSRNEKRSRLGNRRDRNLYKHAKGHKIDANRYAQLCKVADGMN